MPFIGFASLNKNVGYIELEPGILSVVNHCGSLRRGFKVSAKRDKTDKIVRVFQIISVMFVFAVWRQFVKFLILISSISVFKLLICKLKI